MKSKKQKLNNMKEVGLLMHINKKEEAITLAESLYEKDHNYEASCYLGCLFVNGNKKYNVSKNLENGKLWLKKGADNDHANSQFFYGLSYLHNAKKPDEYLKAYWWLQKAKDNGSIYSNQIKYK